MARNININVKNTSSSPHNGLRVQYPGTLSITFISSSPWTNHVAQYIGGNTRITYTDETVAPNDTGSVSFTVGVTDCPPNPSVTWLDNGSPDGPATVTSYTCS